MNRIVFLIPLFVILGFGALFYSGLKDSNDEQPTALAGRDIPNFPDDIIEGFSGGDPLQIVSENSVVLVNFWASWCAPCRAEHPNLEIIREEGTPIIGINYKDQPENASKFLNEMGNPYESIRADSSGRNAIDWGVAGVPETFFVKDGKVVDRHTGPILDRNIDEIRAKIKALSSS